MKINGQPFRTIWRDKSGTVNIIDQTRLPFDFVVIPLNSLEDAAHAIRTMQVRGAPLIGATAAYGMALAMKENPADSKLHDASEHLQATRPTAVNLGWALQRQKQQLLPLNPEKRAQAAFNLADQICTEDIEICQAIGDHGLPLVQAIFDEKKRQKKHQPVHILTHCNAGWLAAVDWGTALAPVYKAHEKGLDIHVWVDETRPRNQGASLTAYELGQHGIPHTVIVDNAGGHLMQHGLVDLCFVGTDRTTSTGDVCNKIGTYLKALAARHNHVPFYVCAPSPSIDFSLEDGIKDIPIEQRSPREVSHLYGLDADGKLREFSILPPGSPARNDAFDVTPGAYITALVTERGLVKADKASIAELFPDKVL